MIARARRGGAPLDWPRTRLRELERIISDRHGGLIGGFVPDTDDAAIYLRPIACCFYAIMRKANGKKPDRAALLDQIEVWGRAPDVAIKIKRAVVRDVMRDPRLDDPDECARELRLSYADRKRLDIRSIGSFDADKAERTRLAKLQRKERERERSEANRRKAGAVPRADYLGTHSLSRTRPWETAGVSRRTWYRLRARFSDGRPFSAEVVITVVGTGPYAPSSLSSTGGRTCATGAAGPERGAGRRSRGTVAARGTTRSRPPSSTAERRARARGPRPGQGAAGAGRRTHASDAVVSGGRARR